MLRVGTHVQVALDEKTQGWKLCDIRALLGAIFEDSLKVSQLRPARQVYGSGLANLSRMGVTPAAYTPLWLDPFSRSLLTRATGARTHSSW